MLKEPNNIITQVLVQFIVNLKPQTRNLRYSRVIPRYLTCRMN